jgi:tyrosine-protein phosphatase YwqE
MNMFSKIFKGRKEKEKELEQDSIVTNSSNNWSFLGTDMHSHLIPSIDDGAQNMEDSLALIREIQSMGFNKIITTPHIKFDHYPNTSAIINQGLKELKQALKENDIQMPITAAAEYFVDDHFMQILENEPLLTVKNNEILIEFSFVFEPMGLFETIFKIQTKGYTPILAHPERYEYWHGNFSKYEDVADRGILIQINTNCLTGHYGPGVKRISERLIEADLVDFIGTDTHHVGHLNLLEVMRRSPLLKKLVESGRLLNSTL